jgi:hypothetical protein
LHNHSTRGSISISQDSLRGFRSDHNIVVGRFEVDDSPLASLARWRSATSQDIHSIVSTPSALFVNYAKSDFRLRPGSPAIKAGEAKEAPRTDLMGKPRPDKGDSTRPDIGAYQHSSN